MRKKILALIIAAALAVTLITFLSWDMDGDGLSNFSELSLGTSIDSADSDGDNLGDGVEVNVHGTDPRREDTDGDGLSDWAEIDSHGTDPLAADTDDDGLTDKSEIHAHGTDPLRTDTDNDGLSDWSEVNDHGSDPLSEDTDNDELLDESEINLGTDILDPDTDDDRLSDGQEVNGWPMTVDGLSHRATSDPLAADSDSDGLTDWSERNTYLSDPRSSDTDGDGASDRLEVLYATDLADASSVAQPLENGPGYPRLFLEIDYMTEYAPSPEAIGYIENYFEDDLGVEVEVTQDEVTSSELTAIGVTPASLSIQESILIESNFHDNPTTHLYIFYGGELDDAEIGGRAGGAYGVALNGEYVFGTIARERTILLHEMGHCLGLEHTDNTSCAMQVIAIFENPVYCGDTWSERNLLDIWSIDEPW